MISFYLQITPPKATSQSAGKRMKIINGRPMFFKNKKAESAENDLTLLCSPHAPAQPLSGSVRLKVDFVFPWRSTETKKRIALGRIPHDKRPDCDNLVKMLGDVLTKLRFYKDDGQVSELIVSKAWGDKVGIYVAIEELALPSGRSQGVLL